MPGLSQQENIQNDLFLNQWLQEKYAHLQFDQTLIQAFLKKCQESGIWLPGLSPLVRQEFITALHLAIGNNTHTPQQNMLVVFNTLEKLIQQENKYLVNQFAKNAGRTDEQAHTIAHYQAQKKSIPDGYWLQRDDMIAALKPLETDSDVYVHTPVAETSRYTDNTVQQAFAAGAKLAFIPVENSGHWTLRIYTPSAQPEFFNPPGDGKCGDHVVAKIYTTAQTRLQKNYGYHETSDAAQVRQNTKALIAKAEVQQSAISPGSSSRWQATKTSYTDTHFSPTISSTQTLNQLFDQWNITANRVVDELANCSPAEKAERWAAFTKDTYGAAEKMSTCGNEAPTVGNEKLASRSLMIS